MKKNTIIMLVGPSCCGKSTFALRLQQELVSKNYTTTVISSDEIRKELIGWNDPGEGVMLEVSHQAFQILNMRVDLHTQYPANNDFVIVDTTGLDEKFRESILAIAEKNNYAIELVVFNLERETLNGFCNTRGQDPFVTMQHMKRLRTEVLPNLNRKKYAKVTIFKTAVHVHDFKVEVDEDVHSVITTEINGKIGVIGDVHECVSEFNAMIEKMIENDVGHVFLIGDIFDKGNATIEMLEALFAASEKFASQNRTLVMLRGNHERYVYKRLKGLIKENAELESSYFTSIAAFEANEKAKEEFIFVYENQMLDCVKIVRGNERSIVLTHAPCANHFLMKQDAVSIKNQNQFYFTSRDHEKMRTDLQFVFDEANNSHPYHVFGHVAHDKRIPHIHKNKIFLDTGCAHGNALSGVIFNKRYVDFVTIPSTREKTEELFSVVKEEDKIDRLMGSTIRLSDDEEKMVRRVIKGGAEFISGTMSPSKSSVDELETLDSAIELFIKDGVTDVIVQPKYMGSRAQFYLHTDRSKNFATSRNGFRIRIPGIEDCMNAYQDSLNIEFNDRIIIDGELMPWYALGKSLIRESFLQYAESIRHHYTELASDEVFSQFEIAKKVDPNGKLVELSKFDEQLKLFGSDSPMIFKGFNILKIDDAVVADNCENNAMMLNGWDEHIRVDLTNPKSIDVLKYFYNNVTTERRMEGIVIKPVVHERGKIPYMKVRNPEYLRLVYGFDYPTRLSELCRQKHISGKLKLSIDEYELGVSMLMAETKENRDHLIRAMFGKIGKEKELDPRL